MSAISVDITSLEARVWLAESMEADALLGLVEQLCTIRMNRHLLINEQGLPTCGAVEFYRASCFEGVMKMAKDARASLRTFAMQQMAEEKTPRAAEEAASGGTQGGGA